MVSLAEKANYFKIDLNVAIPLEFANIFGSEKPITLEIGSGKGEFISMYSRFYPERNFIGIELRDKRINSTLKKLDINRNFNVRLLRLYVDQNIQKYIKPNSIDEIIIHHPDPWPKTRHHKHRLFQHHFIDALYPILKIGGYIRISTDDPDYAKWIIKHFKERDDFVSMYKDDFTMIPPEDHLVTFFDAIKSAEGFDPFFMKYRSIRRNNA